MPKATRPNYTPKLRPLSSLPFVFGKGKNANYWSIKPTDNYAEACAKGSEYAAHLAIYLSQNSDYVGMNVLGLIIKDIDFNDLTDSSGYWVGFFTYLERAIYHFGTNYDPWKWQSNNLNTESKVILSSSDNFSGDSENE